MKKAKYFFLILILIVFFKDVKVYGACHGVGYAHLDVSWRWSINEGINKMKNTCKIQLENMERYPDYKFSIDNACMYEWMEVYYPDIFYQIKKRIAEGRWEPFGGGWSDPICDIPSGEEFIRQWLIGKRYFKEKFNFEVKVGANLDQYSSWPGGNLPQIAKKCGLKYYTFVRGLTKTNGKFFWWQANDGTKLFSHDSNYWFNCPAGNCGCSNTMPALKYYGAGNGGGGPNNEQASNCGETNSCSRLIDFFEDALRQNVPSSTNLTAEGYCLSTGGDKATGILTHRPFIKWYNRKCLCKLIEAEKFSTFASNLRFNYPQEEINAYLGGCKSGELEEFNYPQDEINQALKRYLLWQHHDNLPGNFTWDGVNIAHNDYQIVYNTFENVLARALLSIASHINTEGCGIPVLVFNSLSWPRTGVVEVNSEQIGNPKDVDVIDSDGRIVPHQVSFDGKKKIAFLAEGIPATGYRLYRIIPNDGQSPFPSTGLKVDEKNLVIENEYYRLELDKKTGYWIRVYDKVNKREGLEGKGNILGYSNYDGWPYGNNFDEWGIDLGDADSIEVVESGPVRAKIRVKHGVIYQDTIMQAKINRIDCFTWSDNYKQGGPAYLRVVFSLNIPEGIYTTEGPYGVSVSPDKNTNLEKPTLSWQDLSEVDYGISLINDSKYGGDREKNSIKLSLLSHAEFDNQQMLYSLYPHKGDWREGKTVKASYEVNYPLIARIEENHPGELPESYSFLKATPGNIIVSVTKKHEDSDDALIRVYETNGKKVEAKLVLNGGVISAQEIDMMEWNESQQLSITDETTINLTLNPYEIKTLRVKLPKYFGNRIILSCPKQVILIQGVSSKFMIKLNSARTFSEDVRLNLNFPKLSQIKSKSLKFKLESGKTKEFTIDLGKPLKLIKGESTIDIVYGRRKEIKIIPFEVISSIPRLEKEEVILFKIWEAEDLNHKTGMRVVDEDASNGIAWQGDNEKDRANEHLIYGPYEILPKGRYLVSFRLKIKERVKENVGIVDIFISSTLIPGLSKEMKSSTINGLDFTKEGVYQEFPIIFRQAPNYKNEFRVYWFGKTSLWTDRITLFKLNL